jgi:arsenate reductase
MKKKSVLFLCTGNTCRSQMAEGYLRGRYGDRFESHSSGSAPDLSKFRETNGVHPHALEILKRYGINTEGLHSKLWTPYIQGKIPIDIVLTLCGSGRDELEEACPIFPGQAVKAHWGVDDPSHVKGTAEEVDRAFEEAFGTIRRRIDAMAALPVETMSREDLQRELLRIAGIG